MLEVEAAMEMVSLEIRNHSGNETKRGKARFVQFYPDMI
jgi:hypothetical protein